MSDSIGPPVRAFDLDRPFRQYWRERIAQHFEDSYAGIPLCKFPEDLRVYEHMLWSAKPDTIIEVGVQEGASALWFRDRLATLSVYQAISNFRVIGVDLDAKRATNNLNAIDRHWRDTITLVEGDITEPKTMAAVHAAIPSNARVMLIEDSAHQYATTLAALRGLAHLVPPQGFLVIEDTCVDFDELRCAPDWPRGAFQALQDWLASPEGKCFIQRRDFERYGLTCHPGGFLQRISAAR